MSLKCCLLSTDVDYQNAVLVRDHIKCESGANLSQYQMEKVHFYTKTQSFGDLALKEHKPRRATIVATQ